MVIENGSTIERFARYYDAVQFIENEGLYGADYEIVEEENPSDDECLDGWIECVMKDSRRKVAA